MPGEIKKKKKFEERPVKPIPSEMGYEVRDILSGITGNISSMLTCLNGCVQFCVSPKADDDNKYVDGMYTDYQRLVVIGEGVHHINTFVEPEIPMTDAIKKEKQPGGPSRSASSIKSS